MKLYRRSVGQLNWIQLQTRPDLNFRGLEASTKNKQATLGDLRKQKKNIKAAKKDLVKVTFKRLGKFEDLHIEGYSDASYPTNFKPELRDVGGSVVLLCNKSGNCVPLHWKSKSIQQACNNTKAAELPVHALEKCIDDSVYAAKMLHEIYTGREENAQIPVTMFIDSNSLWENCHSTKQVDEKHKRRNVHNIKQKLEDGVIDDVVWINGEKMIADCLTKDPANSGRLITLGSARRRDTTEMKRGLNKA